MQTSAKPEVLMHTSVYSAHSQNKNDPLLLHSGCHHHTAIYCHRPIEVSVLSQISLSNNWFSLTIKIIKTHLSWLTEGCEVHFCVSSVLGPRHFKVSPRWNGKRDIWSVSTVSSMKPPAQRHAQDPGCGDGHRSCDWGCHLLSLLQKGHIVSQWKIT